MDLTLDEKIRLIEEEGKSASEVHKDPNAGMAFTSFSGSDPGPTSDDEDYVPPQRKGKGAGGRTSPTKRAKPTSHNQNLAHTSSVPTIQLGLMPTAADDEVEAPAGGRVRVWQDDEMTFALERIAEWPEINGSQLVVLINAEFVPQGRKARSRQAVWQRFGQKGVKDALIARLDAQVVNDTEQTGEVAKKAEGKQE